MGNLTDRNLHPDADEAVRTYGMRAMQRRVEELPYYAMQKTRVSAQMLAYWGVLSEAIESVYNLVDEIVVAYGPCPEAEHVNDGSLKRIREFPDPDGKIKVEVRELWKDKKEMRTWCSEHSTGNHCLVLDGDEVWVGLDALLHSTIAFGSPRWVNFWHDGGQWVYDDARAQGTSDGGQRWGYKVEPYGSYCPHYRWSWWRSSYYWRHHSMPASQSGELLFTKNATTPPRVPTSESETCAVEVPECVIYHLGHALPTKVMEAKHRFYLKRDGADVLRQQRMTAWHDWKGKLGDGGDGWVEKVRWKLPGIVQRALKSAGKMRVR